MSTKPKVGIIGCGGIAESHRKGYEQNGITPFAVADASPEQAREFAGKCEGALACASYQELLASGVEAVSICTPPDSHREIALAALERGIHVLCEKPLAGTVEDCHAIEEAAAKSSAAFMVAFRHRFLPIHQTMRRLIRDEGLGEIVLFRNFFGGPKPQLMDRWFGRRAIAGGGALMDTAIHGVDLFRFYCGEVAAASGELGATFPGADVEASGVLSLRSESGALGLVAASWSIGTGKALVEIDTEEGALVCDYTRRGEIVVRRKGAAESEVLKVEPSNGFAEQIAAFLQALARGSAPSPSASDGSRAVEVIHSVYAANGL